MLDAKDIDDIQDWLHACKLLSTILFAVNDSAVEKKPKFHKIKRVLLVLKMWVISIAQHLVALEFLQESSYLQYHFYNVLVPII